ncbi:MAG TPA: hypothetical protein VFA53_08810 [Xanthobacteraceae bacterium]|nr:hypothetical protein [Xanthobacteraceae bacterium]
MSAFIEGLQPRLGICNAPLHVAYARRGIDELLIELAAIGGNRVDFVAKLGFRFGGLFALGLSGFEFLIALLELVDGDRAAERRAILSVGEA